MEPIGQDAPPGLNARPGGVCLSAQGLPSGQASCAVTAVLDLQPTTRLVRRTAVRLCLPTFQATSPPASIHPVRHNKALAPP